MHSCRIPDGMSRRQSAEAERVRYRQTTSILLQSSYSVVATVLHLRAGNDDQWLAFDNPFELARARRLVCGGRVVGFGYRTAYVIQHTTHHTRGIAAAAARAAPPSHHATPSGTKALFSATVGA